MASIATPATPAIPAVTPVTLPAAINLRTQTDTVLRARHAEDLWHRIIDEMLVASRAGKHTYTLTYNTSKQARACVQLPDLEKYAQDLSELGYQVNMPVKESYPGCYNVKIEVNWANPPRAIITRVNSSDSA